MKQTIGIATIVINYKSEARTISFIEEELSKCRLRQAIVIVNNGATKESSSVMAKALGATIVQKNNEIVDDNQHIFIIHNPINSGFAQGNNMGVDFIINHFECDYLLFSNNDIRFVDDNVVETLIDKIRTLPDVGVIGPKVIGLDGHCQSPNDYVPFWTEMVGQYWERFIPLYHIHKLDQDTAEEGYYYRVMGSFFICAKDAFLDCGMMDPSTFLFAEEACLSERMKKLGRYAYYYPNVSVLHDHGLTINKHTKDLKVSNAMFRSLSYYYKTYKGVNPVSIFVASISNSFYLWLQQLLRKIKS